MSKIAVDIDDTLYSFTEEAREQLSLMVDEPEFEAYRTQLSHTLYAKWDQWRTPFELAGFDAEDNSLWLKCVERCHDSDAILRQRPFNGAVEIVNELVEEGHELVYISNRMRETYEATSLWLAQEGFPIGQDQTELVVTAGDKRPFIRDCEYMIDDRVKNIIEFVYDYDYAAEHGPGQRKGFVRVADYNGGLTDVPGLYLAHTWAGLRRYMVKSGLLPKRNLVAS